MYNQRTLIILARRERARIKKMLEWMGHRRDELPVGSLKRNGKYYYRVFYEDGQKNHVMIPEGYSGKWALIDELRERRYISAAMPVLENNLRCIDGAWCGRRKTAGKNMTRRYGLFYLRVLGPVRSSQS